MTNKQIRQWDLARLQLFLAVAREQSLTRAAAVTGVAQPTVSRQISRLEQEFGGRLFLRTGRGVTLSPFGERVLPRVQAIFEGTEALAQEIEEGAADPAGEVRIGALPSLYLYLVMPLFETLRVRMPAVRLRIFEGSGGQIDQWLASGFIDIGLPYRYGSRMQPGIESLAVVPSYLVSAAREKVTSNTTVKFLQLDGLPLVLPGPPSGIRLLLDQLAKKAGITLNVVMEADSSQIQKAAAGRGCYTVLPLHAVAAELESGMLQAARILSPKIDRVIAMGLTSARPSTLATVEVAKIIRQSVRADTGFMQEPS
ncbi:MAG: LysR family transcriptional regulator [Burkholderiaceae bacterium]|nr:LysR family transcriptional regulator [Burkholderiaceae bacterium]